MRLEGVFTAMITPFLQGKLDEEGLRKNIRRQIEARVTGLVFLGSTGEASTLTREEKRRILQIGIEEAQGHLLVIAGTGSNSTAVTIEQTQEAKELGADLALIVTPYYNKPTQAGIFQHFKAITEAVDLPVLIYNHQGRTGVNIETPTLLQLAALSHIAGVKEASSNLDQVADVLHTVQRQFPHFSVLSGDDSLTLPMMALGAGGIISIVSNLFPYEMGELVHAALEGKFSDARKWHEQLLPFFRLALIETNPIPIKEAMHHCGLPAGPCRLPLSSLQKENRAQLVAFFAKSEIRQDTCKVFQD